MKKIITIINKTTGAMSVKTEGYTGNDCYKATEALETGLGLDKACSVPTPENFVQEQNDQTVGGS